uniref:Uncharacterized protein n=1 Tax=Salix viminalis TaxID=40686 RepID=A0A6N2L112_SALVM
MTHGSPIICLVFASRCGPYEGIVVIDKHMRAVLPSCWTRVAAPPFTEQRDDKFLSRSSIIGALAYPAALGPKPLESC